MQEAGQARFSDRGRPRAAMIVDLRYQAKSWSRPRRVVVKIEWHPGELFPRIGFVVTNSRLPASKVIKVYN
ncbi:MAG: transposase, partial [Desulfobaccales bacterium]